MNTFAKKASTQSVFSVIFVIFLAALLVVGVYYLLSFLNGPSEHDDLEVVKEDKETSRTAMSRTGIVSVIGVISAGVVFAMGRHITGKESTSHYDTAELWNDPPSDSVILCDLDPIYKFEECEAVFPTVAWYQSMQSQAIKVVNREKKVIVQCCTDKTKNTTVFSLVTQPSGDVNDSKSEAFVKQWVNNVPFEYCFTTECTSEFYKDRLNRNQKRAGIKTVPECVIGLHNQEFDEGKQKKFFVQFKWRAALLEAYGFYLNGSDFPRSIVCKKPVIGEFDANTLEQFLISNPSTKIGTLEPTNEKDTKGNMKYDFIV